MTLKRMSLLAILAILPAMAAAPATATGGLACSIEDANLSFTFDAPINREFGSLAGLAGGEIKLKAKQVLKMGPELTLERDHVVQYWIYERELRIGINVENDTASVFLWIIAQADKNRERYSGRYVLRVSIFDSDVIGREFKGRIRGCSADG
jgi:hypothetical protein